MYRLRVKTHHCFTVSELKRIQPLLDDEYNNTDTIIQKLLSLNLDESLPIIITERISYEKGILYYIDHAYSLL